MAIPTGSATSASHRPCTSRAVPYKAMSGIGVHHADAVVWGPVYRTRLHLRAHVAKVLVPSEVLHERAVDQAAAAGQRARAHERRARGERQEERRVRRRHELEHPRDVLERVRHRPPPLRIFVVLLPAEHAREERRERPDAVLQDPLRGGRERERAGGGPHPERDEERLRREHLEDVAKHERREVPADERRVVARDGVRVPRGEEHRAQTRGLTRVPRGGGGGRRRRRGGRVVALRALRRKALESPILPDRPSPPLLPARAHLHERRARSRRRLRLRRLRGRGRGDDGGAAATRRATAEDDRRRVVVVVNLSVPTRSRPKDVDARAAPSAETRARCAIARRRRRGDARRDHREHRRRRERDGARPRDVARAREIFDDALTSSLSRGVRNRRIKSGSPVAVHLWRAPCVVVQLESHEILSIDHEARHATKNTLRSPSPPPTESPARASRRLTTPRVLRRPWSRPR
eukprot:30910-Pelagococcus_subviridis.AAC.11